MSWPREQPSARRMPISWPRREVRTSSRLARLTQAIMSTSPERARVIQVSSAAVSPTLVVGNDTTRVVRLPLVFGWSLAKRAANTVISDCAC